MDEIVPLGGWGAPRSLWPPLWRCPEDFPPNLSTCHLALCLKAAPAHRGSKIWSRRREGWGSKCWAQQGRQQAARGQGPGARGLGLEKPSAALPLPPPQPRDSRDCGV